MTIAASQVLAGDDNIDGAPLAVLLDLTRPSSTMEVGFGVEPDAAFSAGVGVGAASLGAMNQGLSGVGNFDLRGAQYSYENPDDDMTRWRLTGRRLGLHTPALVGEYGQQGSFRASLSYDEMRYTTADGYQTLLGGGATNQVLPPGFTTGANTSAMPNLAASLQTVPLHATRKRLGLDLRHWLDREWELRLRLHNDALDGSRIRGADFGSHGGNARTTLLAEPLDSATQTVQASVAFAGQGRRMVLAYLGSVYRNHVDAVTWQNPYTNVAWVGGNTGLPAGFVLDQGRLGVAPDNDFHQFTLNGSYDLSTTTRLTLSAARGRMSQNVPFLPYTINAGLAGVPLPRNALAGRVETRFVLTRLTMRPVRAMSVTAALRFDDRDNRTPQSEYAMVGGDIALQPAANADSDHVRTNLPRSRRLLKWSLDADYRLPGARVVHAAWEQETVRLTYAEVARTTENSYRVGVRQGGTGAWTADAEVAHLVRRGTQYRYNLPYLASYTSAAFINGLAAANGCLDLQQCVRLGPLQQKFYLADRNRDRIRAHVGFAPEGPFSVQARISLHRDRYPGSDYGVVSAESWATGLDLTYAMREDLRFTAFHAFESQVTRERARQVTAALPAGTADFRSDWMNRFADRTSTLGFGVRYLRLMGGRLDLELDLVHVRGRSPIETMVGSAVSASQSPAGALPDLRFSSDSLGLAARYAINRDTTMKIQYLYRRTRQVDWATQGLGAAPLANVVGSADVAQRRTVQGVGITFMHRFR